MRRPYPAIEDMQPGAMANPLAIAGALAGLRLILHWLTNGQHGYFRDELYFLACGEHLDWGYVDHPPLIALIARLSRTTFGDSLHGIRFLSSLAGAGLVFLTGAMARELGGGRFAVFLACASLLLAPVFLAGGTLLTMNAFEPLFWMGAAYVVVLAIRRYDPKLLLWLGVLIGVGLENKHTMLFFAAALVAPILRTEQRRWLSSRWLWLAGAIALALFLPNIVWQFEHQFPIFEGLGNVRQEHKNVELDPLPFLARQLLMLNPVSALVWIAGLFYLLLDAQGKRYRLLGYAWCVLLGLMMAAHGKDYYLAPAYPMLFAAGGVAWERLAAARPALRWTRYALPGAILASGAVIAPLALPMLPPETYLRYARALGFQPPRTEARHEGPLPQHLGDMFGWPEMVEKVAQVYRALPPEERARAGILAGNYGEAGAIDFFGPRRGLPKAISGHQTYYFWGPRQYTGETLILLQADRKHAESQCRSVEDGPRVYHPYAMAEEDYTILICRGMTPPLPELWPKLKHWN